LKRIYAISQGVDGSDVGHIILNPQATVFPGEEGVNEEVNLVTLEVKTALTRIYNKVHKEVPVRLLS